MMKQNNGNISSDDSATRLDKNFSRLLKLTDRSDKPGGKFTESLINSALNELKLSQADKVKAQTVTIKSKWLETVIGWAAMIGVTWGAGLVIVMTVLLKMSLLLEIVVVLTMVFNWLSYLGGHI
jgi:hypothetical protein